MIKRLATAWRWLERRPIGSTVAAAVLVRMTMVIITMLRGGTTFPDEQQYVDLAGAAARGELNEQLWRGYAVELHRSAGAFTRPLSLIYKVTGEERVVAQLFAACFGVALAALIALVVTRNFSKRAGLCAGLVSALWPSQVLFSSTVLRESEVWLALLVLSVCLSIGRTASRTTGLATVLGVIAGLITLTYLRPQTAVIAGAAVVLAAAVQAALSHRVLPLVVLTAVASVIPATAGNGFFGERLIRTRGADLDIDRVELAVGAQSKLVKLPAARTDVETAPKDTEPTTAKANPTKPPSAMNDKPKCEGNVISGGPDKGKPCAIGDAGEAIVVETESRVRTVARGLLAMLVLPLPWSSDGSITSRFAQAENLLWFVLYGAAAVGAWKQRRRFGEIAFPVIMIAGIVGVGALSQGNVGTAFRHRGQILWALIILSAPVFEQLGRRFATARTTRQGA